MCVSVNAQVSPHEFMQSVISASKRRFTIEAQSDPVEFWSWLLNALHFDLTGGKVKKRSIITDCFQVRESTELPQVQQHTLKHTQYYLIVNLC